MADEVGIVCRATRTRLERGPPRPYHGSNNAPLADHNAALRQIAVEVIARHWKEDPETLLILKERAQSDAHPIVRGIAAEVMARHWKEDPEILGLADVKKRGD